jgi:hypothetical protein
VAGYVSSMTSPPHPPRPPDDPTDGDARDVQPDLDADAADEEAAQPGVDPDWSQTPRGTTAEEDG